MSNTHKGKDNWWTKSGEDSPNWRGGISRIDKLCRRMKEYAKWRTDIFTRDNWICKKCNSSGYVTAHHIKSFHNIIVENKIRTIIDARKCEEMWDINNGVTLCENCHSLTDNYKGNHNKKK